MVLWYSIDVFRISSCEIACTFCGRRAMFGREVRKVEGDEHVSATIYLDYSGATKP